MERPHPTGPPADRRDLFGGDQSTDTGPACPLPLDLLLRQLDKGDLNGNAEIGGTVPMWQWIGDEGATTFSY